MNLTRSIVLTLTAILAVILSLPAAGQEVRVHAAISDSRAQVGDEIRYQIVIESSQDVSPPNIVAPPGLSIEYAGATHQPAPVYIVNGRRQDTGPDKYILNYRVTAGRPGEYTIPGQTVRVAGRDFSVAAVRLAITEPPEDTSSILEATLSSEAAYVGEPVTLTLAWYFAADARSVSFATTSDVPRPYDLLAAPDPRPAGARPNDSRYPILQIDGQDAVCTLSRTIRGGREYGVVTLTRTILPTQPGTISIGPFAAIAEFRVGERQLGILLTEDVVERRVSRSAPVQLTVRPLPSEGRPANFSGLVGRFFVETQATPTNVSVGDPIELSIRIRGPEPLDRVDAPDLERAPAFPASFRLAPDGVRPVATQAVGSRAFTTTLRATSDRVTEVPPVELAYFDTAAGEYRTARSTAIPLTVRPTREVTARDAIGAATPISPAAGATPTAPTPLMPAGPGLLANTTSVTALSSESSDLPTLLSHPMWASGLLLPPLAFTATAAYALVRRAGSTPASRRREALRRASRRLRTRPDAVAASIREYIAIRFDLPEHAVTAFDVRRLLDDQSGAAAARQLAELLDRADAARLRGSPPPDSRDAMKLLRLLDKEAAR